MDKNNENKLNDTHGDYILNFCDAYFLAFGLSAAIIIVVFFVLFFVFYPVDFL